MGLSRRVIFALYSAGLLRSTDALSLQSNAGQSDPSPEIDPALQAVMPIHWLHIPKTGLSFVNTLVHLPGACPNMPKDYCIGEFDLHERVQDSCDASKVVIQRSHMFENGIESLSQGGYEAGKGHFMTFLRQPEMRILSQVAYSREKGELGAFTAFLPEQALYRRLAGVYTKQLTRAGSTMGAEGTFPAWLLPVQVTPEEVAKAKERLQTGFAFVGITEHFDLSVCLFNKMFNQPCNRCQFSNVHSTAAISEYVTHDGSKYDPTHKHHIAQLRGFQDPWDHEIYDLGLQIFQDNLRKYNVSEETCVPCYRQAGKYDD